MREFLLGIFVGLVMEAVSPGPWTWQQLVAYGAGAVPTILLMARWYP